MRKSVPLLLVVALAATVGTWASPNTETSASTTGAGPDTSRQEHMHHPRAEDARPNIVLILTDDQNPQSASGMPVLQSEIGSKGVRFTNAVSTTPTCCPSRATLFTGTYPQTNGVWTNWLPHGGWEVFHQLGWDDRTFAVELDNLGYFTAHVGRYMNGYAIAGTREALTGSRDYIPPGWDYWTSFGTPSDGHAGQHQGYYDYWLMSRPGPESPVTYTFRGREPRDYSTDVFNEAAVEVVQQAPRGEPLLLVQSVWAPHKPYTPGPRHVDSQVEVDAPMDINNVAGKPPWIVAQEPLRRSPIKRVLTNQARALLSVDDGIRAITEALADTGRLHNTMFIFVSDNGLVQGRFRIDSKKNFPYAAPIPLMIRWDNAPDDFDLTPGRIDGRLTTLADVYSTILQAVRAPFPASTEGQPLLSRGPGRSEVLLSAWGNRDADANIAMPPYCGLRTKRWLYVRYSRGFEELYDLKFDPALLRNLAGDRHRSNALAELRRSTREKCSPAPPDFTWVEPEHTAP